MRDVRVLVIGNCTVDLSFAVPRFPRAGETLLADEKFIDLGGKGANQAVVAARFGAQTVLAAPIGCDVEGDWARSRLEAEGLASDALLRVESLTDQSIIYVAPGGENCIVSTHRAAAAATPEWAASILSRYARRGDILLMQGNLALETTRAALDFARRSGVTTILNPAPIQYSYDRLLPSTDIVIVNEIEASELGERDDPIAGGQVIWADGSVPYVIVTLGSHGAVLISAEGLVRVPAPIVAAVDTVGAGDTLCGAFAAALATGISITSALRVAITAASLAVTRKGTQSSFPTAVEAADILARHSI
jgi:ribokinase